MSTLTLTLQTIQKNEADGSVTMSGKLGNSQGAKIAPLIPVVFNPTQDTPKDRHWTYTASREYKRRTNTIKR
eukprot:980572-Amphidinium_carterae.1